MSGEAFQPMPRAPVDERVLEVDALPEPEDARLSELLAGWKKARKGRPIPRRTDIDPADFPRTLLIVWIYEVQDDGDYVCRLAGEEQRAVYGSLPVGRALSELVHPDAFPFIRRYYDAVRAGKVAYSRDAVYLWSRDKIGRGERLILPLADADDRCRFVIGATVYRLNEGDLERDADDIAIRRLLAPLPD